MINQENRDRTRPNGEASSKPNTFPYTNVLGLLEATDDLDTKVSQYPAQKNSSGLPPRSSKSKRDTEPCQSSINPRELACHLVDKLSNPPKIGSKSENRRLRNEKSHSLHMNPELKKKIRSLKSSNTLKEYFPVNKNSDANPSIKSLSSDDLSSRKSKLEQVIERQKQNSSSCISSTRSQAQSIVEMDSLTLESSLTVENRNDRLNYSDIGKRLKDSYEFEERRLKNYQRVNKAIDNAERLMFDENKRRRVKKIIDEVPRRSISYKDNAQSVPIRPSSRSHSLSDTLSQSKGEAKDKSYSPMIKARTIFRNHSDNQLNETHNDSSFFDKTSPSLLPHNTPADLKSENIKKVMKLRKDSLKRRKENALMVLEMSKKFAEEEREISDLEKKALQFLNHRFIDKTGDNSSSEENSKKTDSCRQSPIESVDESEKSLNEKLSYFNQQLTDQENMIKSIDEKIASLNKQDLIHYKKSLDKLKDLCNNVIRHLRDKIFETSQVIEQKSLLDIAETTMVVANENSEKTFNAKHMSPVVGAEEELEVKIPKHVSIHESQNVVILPDNSNSQALLDKEDENTIKDSISPLDEDVPPVQHPSASDSLCKDPLHSETKEDYIDQDPTENSEINNEFQLYSDHFKADNLDNHVGKQSNHEVNVSADTLSSQPRSNETMEPFNCINDILNNKNDPIKLIEKSLDNLQLAEIDGDKLHFGSTTMNLDNKAINIVKNTFKVIDEIISDDPERFDGNLRNSNNNNLEEASISEEDKENMNGQQLREVIDLKSTQAANVLTEKEDEAVLNEEQIEMLKQKFMGLIINRADKMSTFVTTAVDYIWDCRKSEETWPPPRPFEFSSQAVDEEDVITAMKDDSTSSIRFIDRELLFDMIIDFFNEYYFYKPDDNVFSVKNRNQVFHAWNNKKPPTEKQAMLDIVVIKLIQDLDIDVNIDQVVSVKRQKEAENSRLKSFTITPTTIFSTKTDMINPYSRFTKLSQWMMQKKSWSERLIEIEARSESWTHYEVMAKHFKNDLTDEIFNEIMQEAIKILE